jgi:ribosomally synthesized peptide (two-chain TOMM family)
VICKAILAWVVTFDEFRFHFSGAMMLDNSDDNLQYQVFLEFRQMLANAIEKAWTDPEFNRDFAKDPKKAFSDPQPLGLGYTFPYDFGLTTDVNSAEWVPGLGVGLVADSDHFWQVKTNSTVVLHLPPAPVPTQRELALAAYQATHWSFFNITAVANTPIPQEKRRVSLDTNAPTEPAMATFGKQFAKAIALAWRDPIFKGRLTADPISAMEDYLHYRCPGILSLQVIAPPESPDNKWDTDKQVWIMPKDFMTVGLPQTPPLAQMDVAGNAYLDAPSGYLIVCC